jgi:hypothetical protein
MAVMDIASEHRQQLMEQVDFLTYEIEYALHRTRAMHGDDAPEEPFHNIAEARLEFLLAETTEVRRQVRRMWRGQAALVPGLQDEVRSRLSFIAPVLESMTHTMVQRRWKPSRAHGATDAEVHVPLNECHPNYATFFRAVENVVHEATRRMADRFFAKRSGLKNYPFSLAPLLVVSRGRGYMLDATAALIWYYVDDHDLLRRRLHLLSYLNMPRHAPAIFRTVPLVAHEMFHYVGILLASARRMVTDKPSLSSADLTDEAKAAVREEFGLPYSLLLEAMSDITAAYRAMLVCEYRRAEPRLLSRAILVWLRQHREFGNRTAEANLLERIATYHFTEILCDLGAVVLAGPAFVRAFMGNVVFSGVLWCTESHRADGDRHPPSLFRARLQLQALDFLGFRQTAAELTSALDRFEGRLPEQARRLLGPYSELARDLRPEVEKLTHVLRSGTIQSPLMERMLDTGVLQARAGDPKRWQAAFSEDRWLAGLADASAALAKGDVRLDGGMSCFDLLNSMWQDYGSKPRQPALRWEFSLSKQRPWKELRPAAA